MSDQISRLENEANFQDQRISSQKKEPRDAFGYLYASALNSYWNRLKEMSTGKRLLVVGCSEYGVTPLASTCKQVVGIDISTVAIEKQRKAIAERGLSERAQVYVMNAEELDFPDDSFDVICCSGVLHHLTVVKALQSWCAVLEPKEGQLIMFEPMKLNPFASIYRVLTPSQRTPDEHPLTFCDFSALQTSFESVQFSANALFTPLSLLCIPFPKLVGDAVHRLLQAIDAKLFNSIPFTKYFAWSTIIHCSGPRKKTLV